jgi:hypothetical protein
VCHLARPCTNESLPARIGFDGGFGIEVVRSGEDLGIDGTLTRDVRPWGARGGHPWSAFAHRDGGWYDFSINQSLASYWRNCIIERPSHAVERYCS